MANSFLNRLFRVDKKEQKKIEKIADQVDAFKEQMAALSNEELQAKTPYFKDLIQQGTPLDNLLPEAYAVAREAAQRTLQQYPYFVQVMGAVALHNGDVAEMKTGEGKTLTSTMCIYLNALTGKGVHVITVNDYLAKRDAEWMGSIYRFLGLSVGVNHRELTPPEKKAAFACDVTYTTNSEIGFDYLRDNMTPNLNTRVLRGLHMAVIDEADSILIDESRTPLIISGGQRKGANLYVLADQFAKMIRPEQHFTIDLETKTVQLTEEGVSIAEKAFKIDNLYRLEHTSLVHHIHQALKANYIMQRDVDYVVMEGAIVIVDQFTGRMLKGRTYSDGLHQAIEAKEKVQINQETTVMATITYQNFFRLYGKLAGMTGTAKTEEEEFLSTYNMRVVEIPTNRPVIRNDATDLVYGKKEYKYNAMVREINERHQAGQPILVGTISVETSELISQMLRKEGIRHEVLNAKNHEREAEIIKKAGEKGSVTIATNMAGRGTDIKLGEGVVELGGLAVIGSERHESRRIDNQLRGRSGRQGDPGYSRFYVSLEDELMQRFGNKTVQNLFESMKEEPIESAMVSRVISTAQMRVEGYNFDIRKNLMGYDDVLRQQREIMYNQRDTVLGSSDVHNIVSDLFRKVSDLYVQRAVNQQSKDFTIDFEKLRDALANRILPPNLIQLEVIQGRDVAETIDRLHGYLLALFEQRKKEWTEPIFKMIEKQILIRIIDVNWTQHIDRMSKLRDGIHLRAYAQTNPLQSYINEGYQMFEDMTNRIAEETVIYCLRAQVKIERKPNPNASQAKAPLPQA